MSRRKPTGPAALHTPKAALLSGHGRGGVGWGWGIRGFQTTEARPQGMNVVESGIFNADYERVLTYW